MPIISEDIEELTHFLQRRRVAPHGVQSRGYRESDADASHQHQAPDALRVPDCKGQRERAAERISHQVGAFDLEGVQHTDGLADPCVHVVGLLRPSLGKAEAGHVWGDHARLPRERGHHETPIRPGGYTGAGAMDQQDRPTCAQIVEIGADAGRVDHTANLGILLKFHIVHRIGFHPVMASRRQAQPPRSKPIRGRGIRPQRRTA